MLIAANKVVTIDYTLTDDRGQVIDSSQGREPLAYLHGNRNIIVGLENALEGKKKGDSLNVAIAPADGYGEREAGLVQAVPRTMFENGEQIEVGMQFHTMTDDGVRVVTVIDVAADAVTVDANHPLAGETLNFAVTVMDVRDASQEELEHGHVHGPDGHHDHD